MAVVNEIMKVSRASTYDYVMLNGHVRAMYRDKYKCDQEENKLKARMKKYPDRGLIKKFRESRGCGTVVKHTVDRIENIQFNTCLCKIKHPLTETLMTMVDMLEYGILPYPGSLMQQPAQAIELMDIVRFARQREQNELRKEADGRRKH